MRWNVFDPSAWSGLSRPLLSLLDGPQAAAKAQVEGMADLEASSMGRSPTFPFEQRRLDDAFRTVYFDEGEGLPLVFVHGLGGNLTHWEFVLRELGNGCRRAGLDLVGFGASEKPRGRYDLKLLRDHLIAFLEMRGLRDAILVGHSLGGGVAVAAALERPDLVKGLVLLGAAGLAPLPRWVQRLAPLVLFEWPIFRLLQLGHGLILDQVFVDGVDENPYVRHFREASLHDAPGFPNLRDFARVSCSVVRDLLQADFSDRLAELEQPLLALWGDSDRLVSLPGVREALQKVARHRIELIPRCGHLSMIERPLEVTGQLRRFLAQPP